MPTGFVVVAAVVLAVLIFAGITQVEFERRSAEVGTRPPDLMLSAADQSQTGIDSGFHWDDDPDHSTGVEYLGPKIAPLGVLRIGPGQWLELSTASHLGLPPSAVAYIHPSSLPRSCETQAGAGCVDVDFSEVLPPIKLQQSQAGSFGFAAPAEAGIYWINLRASWGRGYEGNQVFVLDVADLTMRVWTPPASSLKRAR